MCACVVCVGVCVGVYGYMCACLLHAQCVCVHLLGLHVLVLASLCVCLCVGMSIMLDVSIMLFSPITLFKLFTRNAIMLKKVPQCADFFLNKMPFTHNHNSSCTSRNKG